MIWTALYMFLAWGTARLIKNIFITSDFKKNTAIFFSLVWSLIWVIGAAIVFEYIFGAGTFNKKMLFPSIFSTALVSYYALTAKASKPNSKKNVQFPIPPETEVIPALQTNKTKSLINNIFRKLLNAKVGVRALFSLILTILLFTLILANQAYLIRAEWLVAHQKFEAPPALANTQICSKLSNSSDLTNEELILLPKVNELPFLIDSNGKIVNCENDEYCELFQSSALREIGCIEADNPGSLLTYLNPRIDFGHIISLSIFVGIVIFFSLLTGHEFIAEKSIGWKRLSIVLGGLFSIIGILYIYATEDNFHQTEFLFWLLITPILIPITTIILMLKGKLIFEWIKQGFRENK